jgi:hypothetical protein
MPHWPRAIAARSAALALPVEAGDGVDDFLAGQLAVAVVAVAADPGDPGGAGKVEACGFCYPDGTADDPAVGAVQLGVVRFPRPFLLEGTEDRALEGRLVSLDEQEVVRLPLAGDVLGGLPLRVGGGIRVRIRVSLGATIRRSSGCTFPPSRARTSCGRSAAWSPASRKFLAPASAHATATARTKTSR